MMVVGFLQVGGYPWRGRWALGLSLVSQLVAASSAVLRAQSSPREKAATLRKALVATRNKSRVPQHIEQSTLSNRRPDLSFPMAEPVIDEALREVSPLPLSYGT